jgi:hypothetical protein
MTANQNTTSVQKHKKEKHKQNPHHHKTGKVQATVSCTKRGAFDSWGAHKQHTLPLHTPGCGRCANLAACDARRRQNTTFHQRASNKRPMTSCGVHGTKCHYDMLPLVSTAVLWPCSAISRTSSLSNGALLQYAAYTNPTAAHHISKALTSATNCRGAGTGKALHAQPKNPSPRHCLVGPREQPKTPIPCPLEVHQHAKIIQASQLSQLPACYTSCRSLSAQQQPTAPRTLSLRPLLTSRLQQQYSVHNYYAAATSTQCWFKQFHWAQTLSDPTRLCKYVITMTCWLTQQLASLPCRRLMYTTDYASRSSACQQNAPLMTADSTPTAPAPRQQPAL